MNKIFTLLLVGALTAGAVTANAKKTLGYSSDEELVAHMDECYEGLPCGREGF